MDGEKLVYLCGPMTGLPDWNYPAFNEAEDSLNAVGWDVINPAKNFDGRTDKERKVYMRKAMSQVSKADALAVLQDWYKSPGARLEVAMAKECGIPVYEMECMLDPHFMDDDCAISTSGTFLWAQGPQHLGSNFGSTVWSAPGPSDPVILPSNVRVIATPPDGESTWPCGDCGHQVSLDLEWCDVCYDERNVPVSPRGSVLDEAKRLITGDRNAQYGAPGQDFTRTAAILTALGYGKSDEQGWCEVLEAHDVAMMMVGLKLSRLRHTPKKRDSWVDIAGYAGCGAEVAKADG